MKKSVIAVSVILLVAAGVVLPAGYFGQVAENTLRSRMANMPYGLQIEVVEYQRGWFSSTARLEWQPPGDVGMSAMPAEGLFEDASGTGPMAVLAGFVSGALAIDLEIAHGPVYFAVSPGVGLFNARGRIGLEGEATEAEAETGADSGNYIDVHLSSFSGETVSSRLEFGNLDWRLGPVAMKLAGGQMTGEWTGPSAFQLQYAALDKMEVHSAMEGEGLLVALADLETRTEYPQGLERGAILAPSESNSTIGEFDIAGDDGNTVVRMAGLNSLDTVSLGEDGLYRVVSEVEIQSLDVMGREFAPVELNQEVGSLSQTATSKLVTALSAGVFETPEGTGATAAPQSSDGELQAPAEAPPAGALPGALPELTADFRDALRAMLTHGPYADTSVVALYQGEQSLKLDMRQAFYPDRAPDGVDLASLPAMMSSLEYILDIEVPKAAADALLGGGLVQMGLAQGLLERTNNDNAYSLSLALKNGMLELNGQVLPLQLPAADAPPSQEAEGSPFEESPSFPLEEDEPNPFNQAPPPPPD
ncbi:MAG: DUF945 family protein [Gammaproteobacteria bacterium]|nr:DUF945 family protein [Gammaproteobacteria bacterium]MXW45362.1 DUF945 domain-containing protein [Gammaproteobacteria bacterium]MYD01919.1 DUF945 domain-containing protein [Gammaproteobacteria bacterium]MYI25557.1 DUF945 domain-containing protein [Gammaproteobacteria bacterium]